MTDAGLPLRAATSSSAGRPLPDVLRGDPARSRDRGERSEAAAASLTAPLASSGSPAPQVSGPHGPRGGRAPSGDVEFAVVWAYGEAGKLGMPAAGTPARSAGRPR